MKTHYCFVGRRLCVISALAIAVCLSDAVPATAQRANGTISGRVVDRAGAVLQGARVEVLPSGAVTATDGSSISSKCAQHSREVIHSGRNVQVPSGNRQRRARLPPGERLGLECR